ncbi:MAG: ABC transporter permease subunit [Chloroflexota bacterium]
MALLPDGHRGGADLRLCPGGAVGVEEVFAWPGMGSLIVDAIVGKDYPVLQGVFLVIATCVVAANPHRRRPLWRARP